MVSPYPLALLHKDLRKMGVPSNNAIGVGDINDQTVGGRDTLPLLRNHLRFAQQSTKLPEDIAKSIPSCMLVRDPMSETGFTWPFAGSPIGNVFNTSIR